jgi:ABC-type antimicrobial peptide transport system permease subunit
MVATKLSQQRSSMWLFAALAGLAFLLSSVGIYSVLAYSVRSRASEISISCRHLSEADTARAGRSAQSSV